MPNNKGYTSMAEGLANIQHRQKVRQQFDAALSDQQQFEVSAPGCVTCADLGLVGYHVPLDHPYWGKLFPCPDCIKGDELHQLRMRKLNEAAGMPRMYARFTFRSFLSEVGDKNSPRWKGKRLAYSAAWQFVQTSGHFVSMKSAVEQAGAAWDRPDQVRPGLILSGDPGVGKTGLMCAIYNALIDAGERPSYVRTADLLEYIQGRYGKKDEGGNQIPPGPDEIKALLKDAPVLMVDEFFIGRPGDVATSDKTRHIEDIMEARKANQRPTIITCNQNLDQLKAHWGPVIYQRIAELCHFVPMGGIPLRDTDQPVQEAF